jgi:probable phosphomutase (TIGR03848 family)
VADTDEVPAAFAQPASGEDRQDQPQREAPTRILLIRHGLNDYVKEHRLAGRTPGVHLNEEGQLQVAALAERLASTPIAAVYSSPLERARETAEPLAARLGLAVQILNGAAESGCGDWTGQLIEELSKGDLWRQVQVCPSAFRFPGGESFAEIQARMVVTLDGLRAAHPGQTLAMVSHADPIKLAVAFYTGVPLDLFQRLVVAPASITELEFTPFRTLLVRLNDTAHLPGARPPVEPEHKGP